MVPSWGINVGSTMLRSSSAFYIHDVMTLRFGVLVIICSLKHERGSYIACERLSTNNQIENIKLQWCQSLPVLSRCLPTFALSVLVLGAERACGLYEAKGMEVDEC